MPEIQYRPGMADELLRELGPLLAEEGIDLNAGEAPDIETLQRAMSRAVERHNVARFTPVGEARELQTWSHITETPVGELVRGALR